jgi:hypothetical protein
MDSKVEVHSAIVGGAEGSVHRGREGFRRWSGLRDAEVQLACPAFGNAGFGCLGMCHFSADGQT